MNREQAKDLGQVMLAWAEGKTVQWRRSSGGSRATWTDAVESLVFDTITNEYRIKPTPVERWGVKIGGLYYSSYSEKALANSEANRFSDGRVFLMREVIEE